MRTIKLLLIFMIFGFSANAQDLQQQIYRSDGEGAVLVLNNEIIGSIYLLNTIPPEQIQEVTIHREEQLSTQEILFNSSSTKSGLIKAKTDFNFKAKTQAELNEFFGLNSNSDLYVNGFLLENKKYKISSNSIAKIEIIAPDNVFLEKRALNVTIK